jgi:hypothetical protein
MKILAGHLLIGREMPGCYNFCKKIALIRYNIEKVE